MSRAISWVVLSLGYLVLLLSTQVAFGAEKGLKTFQIQSGDRDRKYMVYQPPSYTADGQAAVVFALHGGGGHMEIQAEDKYYRFRSTADRHGFLVVFPNGSSRFPRGRLATWNAGDCCAYARDKKIDDVAFLKAVVKDLEKHYRFDAKKVFATGMSNGGMMTYRLACEASDVFRAIAPVAGTDGMPVCQPGNTISIFHIHSRQDEQVLFLGGRGKEAAPADVVTEFKSVPDTIAKWVKLNGCAEKPKRDTDTDKLKCDLYAGCRDGRQVRLCVTEDGGHSWPGGAKPRKRGPTPSTAIDATEEIWKFFSRQSSASR